MQVSMLMSYASGFKEAVEEIQALERAGKASNDMSATMDELQSGFHERGEKLSKLSDKTAELADASAEFEAMCRKLNQQQQRKAWW